MPTTCVQERLRHCGHGGMSVYNQVAAHSALTKTHCSLHHADLSNNPGLGAVVANYADLRRQISQFVVFAK